MGELINGRTPEEIKKGLKMHAQGERCVEDGAYCPYYALCKKRFPPVMRDALALIERLESERDAELAKVPRWIKPKEELPKGGKSDMEFCEIVNIVLKNGDVTSGWMSGYEGFAYVIRGDNDYISRVPITDVEYWMPLPKHPRAKPEPPKVGESNEDD